MSANVDERRVGGEGGIRTPDTVTRMPHFECGAFNHSATSPWPQKGQISPSVGGYVSNARRLNKSVVLTQIGHYRSSVARSRQKNLATSVALARGRVLPEPADNQVGDRKVILIHHQHVGVALVAGLEQQQELGRAAGRLDGVDGRGAAVAALVPIRPGRTLAVVAPH